LELMTTKFACEEGVFIPEQRLKNAVLYVGRQNLYCPIKNYLDRCASEYKPHPEWENLSEVFLGSPHPKLATIVMQRMMIGAVARAYNPGCNMSWMPILVGKQGIGKSMFSRNLVPEGLFVEISTPLDKLMEETYRLHSGWLLELPEVDDYFTARHIQKFKNLLTTQEDLVRFPYAQLQSILKRRFIMIGTTNRTQFLVDSTGNRRFVPLEIGRNFLIPWRRLAQEREQLWHSAVMAYREGQQYEFVSSEIQKISNYVQQFGDPDPWMDKIIAYLASRTEVKATDILTKALGIDTERLTSKETKRVASVMESLGWERKQTTRQGKSVRLWLRPENDPIDEDDLFNEF